METKQNKTMSRFPKRLEEGMKVTAVCMGREVGNYVVDSVSFKLAFLKVENSENSRIVTVARKVGENGILTVKRGGLEIQATDYFVEEGEE